MQSAGLSSEEPLFAPRFDHKDFRFVDPSINFEIPEFICSDGRDDMGMYDVNMNGTFDLTEMDAIFSSGKSLWPNKKQRNTFEEMEHMPTSSNAFVEENGSAFGMDAHLAYQSCPKRNNGSFVNDQIIVTDPMELAPQPPIDRVKLSEKQKAVVRAVVTQRKSVFFTGNAGTGKTLLLQRILELLPARTTVVTAATGVAACQIGGMTLHSFAGFGIGGVAKEECLKIVRRKKNVSQTWKKLTHLVIDEISMIDAHYFTCLEYVARKIRDKENPFGGIQLVITGDFLQLPPVASKNEEPTFCFESPAWSAAITTTILLKEVRRQNDVKFIRLLQEIRIGRCPSWVIAALQATQNNCFSQVVATRLCTHAADADFINQRHLRELKGDEKMFWARDNQTVNEHSAGLIPKCLILKVNAQVMLTKNLDLSRGLSNGARGVVTGFATTGLPLVKFLATDKSIELRPSRFQIRSDNLEPPVMRRQVPLQLAWAISIHKSQGLTLDAVEMNLQKIFAEGQAYVALSRARSLDSLKVHGFHANCVRTNQTVLQYYENLHDIVHNK